MLFYERRWNDENVLGKTRFLVEEDKVEREWGKDVTGTWKEVFESRFVSFSSFLCLVYFSQSFFFNISLSHSRSHGSFLLNTPLLRVVCLTTSPWAYFPFS